MKLSLYNLLLSASLGLVLANLFFPSSCEAIKLSTELHKVTMSKVGMGTFITITTIHQSQTQAKIAIDKAYTEIQRLSSILSHHDPSSALSYLNKNASLSNPPPELYEVLKASLYYNRLSSGYFDITILPVLNLYKESFKSTKKPPSASEMQVAMSRVGSKYINLTSSSISFSKPNMQISLDSIAKGYIIDRAMDILKQHSIENALINAGGDIVASSSMSRDKVWRIAIQDPQKKDKNIEVVEIKNGALASSGNYEIYFDEEKIYHHLISPLSSKPVKNISSVTVKAQTLMQADALATATFVMGVEKGMNFIEDLANTEVLIVDAYGKTYTSKAWYKKE